MNVVYMWGLGIALALSTSVAQAQAVHGVLRVVKGDVQIKSAKSGQTVRARMGEKVFPKDSVITGKDSRAKIVMVDNNEINVSPESQIEIQNYEYDPAAGKKDVLLNVIYGKVRNKVEQKYDGKTSKFQIKTPSAVAGVRGTDFLTGVQGGVTNIVTFEGKVELGLPGPGGTITNPVFVTPGTTASVSPGSNPTPPAAVPKDQLAKMDGDSKADSPKNDAGGAANDTRQPAGNDKKDNSSDKNKSQDGSDKNKGAGQEKNGNNGNGGNSGDGKSAGAGGSPSGSGNSSNRAPANDASAAPGGTTATQAAPTGPAPGSPPPATGGCTMCVAGPAGPSGPTMLPPPSLTTGPLILPPLPPPPTPICAACIDLNQAGSTKLIIHINTGGGI